MDANRISGSLQKYPESGCNNQNYALSQKGQSLLWTPNEGIEKSKKLGRCGRQNMLQQYIKIWDLIFGHALEAFYFLGVRKLLCFFKFVSRANNLKSCPLTKWPRKEKCSRWKFFGTNHPQTLRFFSKRGPKSPDMGPSQHYISQKWYSNISKFLQKKISRLDRRNFLHLLNDCRGLTTWFLQISIPKFG